MKKIIYDLLPSTQTEVRLNLEKFPTPFVIMSRNQTDGYGKYGRRWESYEGNFAATFALDLKILPSDLYKVPMAISIKLCQIFHASTYAENFSIKWPNDILLNKKKICGILIERIDNYLLIGIGINLRHSPEEDQLPYTATNIFKETGILIESENLLDQLSLYFDQFEHIITESEAVELRQIYLSLLHGKGEKIKVVTRQEIIQGVLQGINHDGALILCEGDQEKLIYAADIF